MTANDMRYNVLVGIDGLFQGTAPGYTDKQMSAILNKAQRRVFNSKVPFFDKDEKVKKMLSPLIRRASTSNDVIQSVSDTDITNLKHDTTYLKGKFYRLPSDTGYVVEEYAVLEDDVDNGVSVVAHATSLYFTAREVNTEFIGSTTITNLTGDLAGSVVTGPTGPAVARVDEVIVTGTSGTALITCNGVSRIAKFDTDLGTTVLNFEEEKYDDYYYSGGYGTRTDLVIVYPIDYDYFLKNYNNSYKKPYEKLIWRLDYKHDTVSTVNYYTSEIIFPKIYVMINYNIAYVKFPTDITVNTGTPADQVSCEISNTSFQDEVVGEAIKIITAALNGEGYQVAAAEKQFDVN